MTAVSLFVLVTHVPLPPPAALAFHKGQFLGPFCLPYLFHLLLSLPITIMSVSNNTLTILSYTFSLSLNSSFKIHDLENCLLSLHSSFAQNGLALNPDKLMPSCLGYVIHQIALCHLTRRCRWHLIRNIGQVQATRSYL